MTRAPVLRPDRLIAAAINADGCIELPAAEGGGAFPLARALVRPGARGAFDQRIVPAVGRATDWAPLDLPFFARCLALALGPVTPDLFALRGVGAPGQSRGRFVRTDAAAEAARLQTLRGAFLVACEDRPI